MLRPFLQIDVFAPRPGTGNPLGVVLDATGLDAAAMQHHANWANLSETVYFFPPTQPGADVALRIFTPKRELPFAGHPTVGAAYAALASGRVQGRDTLTLECPAGLLAARGWRADGALCTAVRTPALRELPIEPRSSALLDAALAGVPRGAQAPAFTDNGPKWWLVELADAQAVRAMQPDLPAIAALSVASGAVGVGVYGRSDAADHALAVRVYCPADNIPEDPVTGSAQAAIAGLLHARGALGSLGTNYRASQGRELGRDGQVDLTIDADGAVWVGGPSQTVVRGEVEL